MPTLDIKVTANVEKTFRFPIAFNNLTVVLCQTTIDLKDVRSRMTKGMTPNARITYNEPQQNGQISITSPNTETVRLFYGMDEFLQMPTDTSGAETPFPQPSKTVGNTPAGSATTDAPVLAGTVMPGSSEVFFETTLDGYSVATAPVEETLTGQLPALNQDNDFGVPGVINDSLQVNWSYAVLGVFNVNAQPAFAGKITPKVTIGGFNIYVGCKVFDILGNDITAAGITAPGIYYVNVAGMESVNLNFVPTGGSGPVGYQMKFCAGNAPYA